MSNYTKEILFRTTQFISDYHLGWLVALYIFAMVYWY